MIKKLLVCKNFGIDNPINDDMVIKMFADFEINVGKSWKEETTKQQKKCSNKIEKINFACYNKPPNNNSYYLQYSKHKIK